MTQKLHLVFGGELKTPKSREFRNVDDIDIVGVFSDFESALKAWQAITQRTVDNAHMRYFIADLHQIHFDAEKAIQKT